MRVVDLAQLSLAVYGLNESNFNPLWSEVKSYTDSNLGLKMSLYLNSVKKIGAVAIRGSDNEANVVEDLKYVVYADLHNLYKSIIQFVGTVKKGKLYPGYKIDYITGHSLGGIMAKMVAPVTKTTTIAFNASGVRTYCIQNRLNTNISSVVKTYISKGDIVGHFREVEDFGNHYEVVVNGVKEIKLLDAKSQHSMTNLFNTLTTNSIGLNQC